MRWGPTCREITYLKIKNSKLLRDIKMSYRSCQFKNGHDPADKQNKHIWAVLKYSEKQ